MKDTREVFRRVFGNPKDGPFLTLRVGTNLSISNRCQLSFLLWYYPALMILIEGLQCKRDFMFNHNHSEAWWLSGKVE